MLHRPGDRGTWLITQPAHALVSGQIARAWGNDRFGFFEPREEVCLAAGLHDIGWLEWEASPSFNSVSGLPHHFRELETAEHLRIWRAAAPAMTLLNRYAALLVSMHGTALYTRFGKPDPSPHEQAMIEHFLQEQDRLQNELLEHLRREERYRAHCAGDVLERHRRLIAVLDWLSLVICMGVDDPITVERVPAGEGEVTLTLRKNPSPPAALREAEGSNDAITVNPWPFAQPELRLFFDARLVQPVGGQEEMRSALAAAPRRNFTVRLVQAE
jgi:hypothetical protein